MNQMELKNMQVALFVIDLNNGFCNSGALADPTIKGIVPSVIKLIKYVKKRNQALFFVDDAHTLDSVELNRYPNHCIEGTTEAQTIKELEEYKKEATKTFNKNSTCALFAPGVTDTIDAMKNLEQVIIAGCCTDICIQNFAVALKNYFDELNRDIDIIVVESAVETYHIPGIHERDYYNNLGLTVMENNGIKLIRKGK